MRLLRNLLWFVVGVLISACFMVPSAFAQVPDVVGPFSPYPPRYNPYLPNPATGAPSAYSQATAAGVSVAQSGTATVRTPTGVRIPVPVTQTANVSKAAIAKAAAKVGVKAIPGVATAYALAELVDILGDAYRLNDGVVEGRNDGPHACIPAGSSYRVTQSNMTSGLSADSFENAFASFAVRNPNYSNFSDQSIGSCTRYGSGCTCAVLYKRNSSMTQATLNTADAQYPVTFRPISEAEIEQAALNSFANQDYSKRMYDALKRDEGVYEGTWSGDYNPVKSTTPVTVSASPVTSSPRVVSTTETPRADGSVDTTTVTETTTVSPVVTGSTHGDTKIAYPSHTTTTTTVTNNVTNITNTTTTVTNHLPAEEAGGDGSESPTDPCTSNPTRVGCAVLGDPPPAEDIPKQDVPISITPVVFASAAGCPAPITFEAYGSRSISFEPMCNTVSGFRPLFLALASLTAAIVFMGALKL